MLRSCAAGYVALSAPILAVLLVVGCADERAEPSTASSPGPPSTSAAVPSTSTPQPQPTPQTSASPAFQTPPQADPDTPTAQEVPAVARACSDGDLTVTNGQIESADTMRRVVVSFANTSSDVCAFVGYPSADLVTAAGGVLVHVARRPANAAPRLELHPGEVATADVRAFAIDAATGDSCGRTGTLVVTPPDAFQSRLLEVNLPICDASISSVG